MAWPTECLSAVGEQLPLGHDRLAFKDMDDGKIQSPGPTHAVRGSASPPSLSFQIRQCLTLLRVILPRQVSCNSEKLRSLALRSRVFAPSSSLALVSVDAHLAGLLFDLLRAPREFVDQFFIDARRAPSLCPFARSAAPDRQAVGKARMEHRLEIRCVTLQLLELAGLPDAPLRSKVVIETRSSGRADADRAYLPPAVT